jgi:hypothetical protein
MRSSYLGEMPRGYDEVSATMIATPAPPLARTPPTAVVAIALSVLVAVAVVAIELLGGEPFLAVRAPAALGLGVLAASPAVLGWLGTRGRAALAAAAAGADLVLVYVGLLSLVGLIVLPIAVLFAVASTKLRGRSSSGRTLAAVAVALALGTLALLALFRHDDPVCWARTRSGAVVRLDPAPFVHGGTISMRSRAGETESGCSSDSISPGEAVTSAAIVVTMLVAAWAIAAPRPPAAPAAPAVREASPGA